MSLFPTFLNRRRQAIFFGTVLAVGIGLVDGAQLHTILGIIVIGVGLSWPLGSDDRAVLIAIAICGFIASLIPLTRLYVAYRRDVRESEEDVARFERDLKRLMWKYPIYTIVGDARPGKRTEHQEVADVYQFSYALKQMGYTDSEVENAKSELSKNWDDFRFTGRFAVEFPVKVESGAGTASNVMYSLEHSVSDDLTDSKQTFFERRPSWYEKAVASGISVGRLEAYEKPRDKPARFNIAKAFSSQPSLTYSGLALGLYGLVAATAIARRSKQMSSAAGK